MHKILVSTCVALSLGLTAPAHAGNPQAWGTGVGAAVGTALAGPLGLVAGGIVGSLIGHSEALHQERQGLETALADSREQLTAARASLPSGGDAHAVQLAAAGSPMLPVPGQGMQKLEAALIEAYVSAVYFQSGSDTLEPYFAGQLERIPALTDHFPGIVVKLDGHADPRGPHGDNLSLSARRVARVRELLIQAGVPRERIAVLSHGEAGTVSRPGEAAAFPYDRRVSITLLAGPQGRTPVAGDNSAMARLDP